MNLPASILLFAWCMVVSCDNENLSVATPQEVTDVFVRPQAPKIDVLWVIDNSASMEAEQQKLAVEAGQFLATLQHEGVDFHMGVITTDPHEAGVLRPYSGPAVLGCSGCRYLSNRVACADASSVSSCDGLRVLQNLVLVGGDGSALGRAFEQVAFAFGLDPQNPMGEVQRADIHAENTGFLRGDANLLIIFVADEDEGLKGADVPVQFYARLFAHIKARAHGQVVAASVVGWPLASQVEFPLVLAQEACTALAGRYSRHPSEPHPKREVALNVLAQGVGCVDESASPSNVSLEEHDPFANAQLGRRYVELACRMGGRVANICESGYAEILSDLALLAVGLSLRYPLSRASEIHRGKDCLLFTSDDVALDCDGNGRTTDPIDGPICVSIGGQDGVPTLVPRDVLNGWTWDDEEGAIHFAGPWILATGSTVRIRYRLYRGSDPCG